MKSLLSGWTTMRCIRLVLAALFLAAGIGSNEPVAYAMAAFLGLQAIFNVGCCSAACAPGKAEVADKNAPITYEEVR